MDSRVRRQKYIARNQEYVDIVRETMYCERCFENERRLLLYSTNNKYPSIANMITSAYSLKAIKEKIETSSWYCRTCLNHVLKIRTDLRTIPYEDSSQVREQAKEARNGRPSCRTST